MFLFFMRILLTLNQIFVQSWSQSLRLRRCTCWRCVTSSPTCLLHLELECFQEKVSSLSVREEYPCWRAYSWRLWKCSGYSSPHGHSGTQALLLYDSVISKLLITIWNWLSERETAWRTTQRGCYGLSLKVVHITSAQILLARAWSWDQT